MHRLNKCSTRFRRCLSLEAEETRRQLDQIKKLTERILETMSAQTDALSAQFDSLQTSLTSLAGHQNQAFADLNAAIAAGEDKATLQALTARAQGFTTDIANLDLAATAADPGTAIVTQPGTPAAVTPAEPPTEATGGTTAVTGG